MPSTAQEDIIHQVITMLLILSKNGNKQKR